MHAITPRYCDILNGERQFGGILQLRQDTLSSYSPTLPHRYPNGFVLPIQHGIGVSLRVYPDVKSYTRTTRIMRSPTCHLWTPYPCIRAASAGMTVGDVRGGPWRCDQDEFGTLEPGPTLPTGGGGAFDQLTPASCLHQGATLPSMAWWRNNCADPMQGWGGSSVGG